MEVSCVAKTDDHACDTPSTDTYRKRVGLDQVIQPERAVEERAHRCHYSQFQAENLPVWQAESRCGDMDKSGIGIWKTEEWNKTLSRLN